MLLRVLCVLALTFACSGGDLFLPEEGEPASIEIIQGNEQFGRVGEPLAEPIVAQVSDSRGRPVPDVPVTLELYAEEGAEVVPDSARTDADGVVDFRVVLGPRIGPIAGEVRVATAGGAQILEAAVRLTALSAEAAGMTLLSGDGQSAPAGTALPESLVVQVADVFGNPIAGVPISWTAEEGGTVGESVVETDADGRSSVERILGAAAGPQRTKAGADGLAGSPVTFQHTATAGAASQLTLVSGDGQTAIVGTPVPDGLVVRLLDAAQNPVPGVPVAWVVGQGVGTAAPQTTPTAEDGTASTRWTLGPAPGEHTITAVVSGVGVVRFHATAVPGTPPGMRLLAQPPGSARRGVLLSPQPIIQLLDPQGSDMGQAGVAVTVAVGSGGGQVRGTLTRTTDDAGRATFTDLSLEGPPGQYTLAFGAAGFTGAVSDPISLGRALTATTIVSDAPDPSAPGASVRVVFSVQSDGGQVPGNVVVLAEDGASCEAAVATGACSLAPTLAGPQQITASYAGSEQFEPSSDGEEHLVQVPAVPALALATPPPGSVVAGVPFDPQPVVQLRDGAGGDLQVAGVQVTAAVASGSGALIGVTSSTTDAGGRATFSGLGITGALGAHTLQFTAPGFAPVTSGSIEVRAIPTTTRIDSDAPDPSLAGQPVDVRFTVTAAAGTPSGNVTVTASTGESCTGAVAAGGCPVALLQPGGRTLTARYPGGGLFASSQDTETHSVVPPPPAPPSASVSSVTVDPATIPAITGRAAVRVQVRDAAGNTLAGIVVQVSASGSGNTVSPGSATTDRSGVARFELSSTVAEVKTVTAVAAGVTLDQRPTVTVTRASTETLIESDDPDPSEAGAPVAVRFSVEGVGGTPTGNVTVSGGGGSCTASVGAGGCTLVLTETGGVTLTASYGGDAAFAGSADTEEHEVRTPAERILRLATEPSDRAVSGLAFERQPVVQLALEGQGDVEEPGVTVSARLASGSGALQGQPTAVTDGEGRAAFTDLAIAGEGAHTLEFSAAGYRSVGSGTIDVARAPSTTVITGDSPDPSAPDGPVTVSFTVTSTAGSPAGTVTVTASGGPETCSADVAAGSCTITLSGLGDRELTAAYGGSATFEPSSDTEPHEVEAPNATPVAADDAYQALEDDEGPLDISAPGVLGNDQDADGDDLSAESLTGPANGSLSLDSSGGFRYDPQPDFFGDDGFTYRARDGSSVSDPATVRVVVRPVNDAPSFTAGPDQSVGAGAGPQTVEGWATGIAAGPPNEAGQSRQFLVQVVSGAEFFVAGPTVASTGTLSYTPAAAGTAQVEVRLQDDGGTADGGSDTSPAVTITFSFTP